MTPSRHCTESQHTVLEELSDVRFDLCTAKSSVLAYRFAHMSAQPPRPVSFSSTFRAKTVHGPLGNKEPEMRSLVGSLEADGRREASRYRAASVPSLARNSTERIAFLQTFAASRSAEPKWRVPLVPWTSRFHLQRPLTPCRPAVRHRPSRAAGTSRRFL